MPKARKLAITYTHAAPGGRRLTSHAIMVRDWSLADAPRRFVCEMVTYREKCAKGRLTPGVFRAWFQKHASCADIKVKSVIIVH